MKLISIGLIGALCLSAQSADVRITAQLLSAPTTSAMFGRLPKSVTAAAVQVCSNLSEPLTIPQSKLVQQFRATNGYTILPKNTAAVVVDAAQGRSALATTLRIGITVVQFASIAAGWSNLNETIKGTLNSSSVVGASALNVLATNLPSHSHLTFASEMLADPVVLTPLGCGSGLVLVEFDPKSKSIDFGMPIKLR